MSNGEINRELQILKRTFSLAITSGRIAMRPDIPMLEEDNVRTGFFEREQYQSVLAHLPDDVQLVIEFGYLRGWRIPSEVLTLEGRHVDFYGREVKLDAANSKNKKPRTFPFTAALRTLLGRGSSARRRRTPAAHEAREQLSRPERSAIERL